MKSSTGQYYPGLDHIRALAAFMVFTWHFTHGPAGFPVPFEGAPWIFPLALFDEGHTGVALFMVLSGYLFAKLLSGRSVRYLPFFWNRFLRLAPLLILVFIVTGIIKVYGGEPLMPYLKSLSAGFTKPTWPNGGWSIAVEMRFYIALPFVLYLSRRWKAAPLAAMIVALAIRIVILLSRGELQFDVYFTLIGRADDFLMEIAAFNFRSHYANKHWLAMSVVVAFVAFFWTFDYLGGFYQVGKASPIWVVLPTAEAVAYSTVVAYYDTSFRLPMTGVSWALSKVGDYSYSIYLLHFFFVFDMASFVHQHVMDISNFYVACAWSLAGFALMLPIGFLSFNFFELPFLRLRKRYLKPEAGDDIGTGVAQPANMSARP